MSHRLSLLRASHETFNGRLKKFAVLSCTFHHAQTQHFKLFFAVLNVVSVLLEDDPITWVRSILGPACNEDAETFL